MNISINGEPHVLDEEPAHLDDLLRSLGHELTRVAVEKNGSLVPRGRRVEVTVEEGDALEVVSLVGGG